MSYYKLQCFPTKFVHRSKVRASSDLNASYLKKYMSQGPSIEKSAKSKHRTIVNNKTLSRVQASKYINPILPNILS